MFGKSTTTTKKKKKKMPARASCADAGTLQAVQRAGGLGKPMWYNHVHQRWNQRQWNQI